MNSTDPFESYENQIKELKEQRDNLVDACDGLLDCLIDWVETADKDADLTRDNAAIEKANEAIRATQPAKISLGWPDSQTVTVFLDGKHVATMTNAPGYENGIPMELFDLMRSAHDLLIRARRAGIVFRRLEDWREMDATDIDELICSELLNCDTAIDKAEGKVK